MTHKFVVGQQVKAPVPWCPNDFYIGTVVCVEPRWIGIHFESSDVDDEYDLNRKSGRGYLFYSDHGDYHVDTVVPLVLKTNLTEE